MNSGFLLLFRGAEPVASDCLNRPVGGSTRHERTRGFANVQGEDSKIEIHSLVDFKKLNNQNDINFDKVTWELLQKVKTEVNQIFEDMRNNKISD